MHLKVYKGDGSEQLPEKYGLRALWEEETIIET